MPKWPQRAPARRADPHRESIITTATGLLRARAGQLMEKAEEKCRAARLWEAYADRCESNLNGRARRRAGS